MGKDQYDSTGRCSNTDVKVGKEHNLKMLTVSRPNQPNGQFTLNIL